MAMIVPQYERTQVEQARQPVGVTPVQSGIGKVAQGLADVGTMLDRWQADVDEADAKAADTRYSDLVRKTLYEDQTGYLYAQGGDALSRRQQAAEVLQRDYDDILKGLSPRAREMAQASMESRRQSALTSVDRHAGGERITYLDSQSDARVRSAIDDAIIDPALIDRSLSIARNEIAEKAQRNGWAPEVRAQAVTDAEGSIHAGVVARVANVDPRQALDYLNAHRDSMSAKDVARLEGALLPEAKRRRGRDIGYGFAQEAAGIGGEYYAAIRSAESGGNDAAKNPNSTATGRYQFIQSTWDGLRTRRPDLGLTADGRLDPVQQEKAIRAFTEENARALVRGGVAITNGTLYAAHFLGAGGALKVLTAPMMASVAEIVGAGVMSANRFLEGMSVADFISWAERKAGGAGGASAPSTPGDIPSAPVAGPPRMDPVTQMLSIEDPDVRAAALEEYQLWTGQLAAQQKALQDAAQQSAFAMIEAGGDVDSLTLDQKMQIGQGGMTSLREYQGKVRRKEPIETDPELYVELTQQAAADPQAFTTRDPLEWLGRLSDTDFKAMVKLQTEQPAADRSATISTINTISKDILTAAGIDGGKKSGAKKVAQLQEGLLRWSQQFQASNNGRLPSHLELREQANALMLQVVIDPPGMFNRESGRLYEIDFEGVTPADIMDGNIRIGGERVKPEVVEAFVLEFTAVVGRAPSPQEVVEGLAWAAER